MYDEWGEWRPAVPVMARTTDPEESHSHDAALDKKGHARMILERLVDSEPQTYITLCDFGQRSGPAAYRTLLTHLEREGLVLKVGKRGNAALFAITDAGRRSL